MAAAERHNAEFILPFFKSTILDPAREPLRAAIWKVRNVSQQGRSKIGKVEERPAGLIAKSMTEYYRDFMKRDTTGKEMSDEERAGEAYRRLEASFQRHVTNFAIEAGRHIIDTFRMGPPSGVQKEQDQRPALPV